ncbi:M10 family metallopeptidase C-terminal domain-containing protein [uncultured Aliiroseovarius sp.]|uniref:M10 family metallopeptidase n=1 Tax=uncultured Aliiroseovarius sp. TaxID=1658783 RepID=UPI0025946618|nr:M10 family metallopeptidase C-terminal domain-containing protein [uncultured Aliiroseovarius sp.]
MANGTLFALSGYLANGFWHQSGGSSAKWNLTGGGSSAQYGTITYNVGYSSYEFAGLSFGRQQLVRKAFDYLSNVTGINFKETGSSNGDIVFGDSYLGAFAFWEDWNGDGFINKAYVNIDYSWNGWSNAQDDYIFQTILHEIGHALGLGHQGLYNGDASFPESARFSNDSWQNSIMSYFPQTDNPNIRASYAEVQTFMAADLLALDRMYGKQSYDGKTFGTSNAFTDHTIYGFNSTISTSDDPVFGRMAEFGTQKAYTIADGGGWDTLDFSGWSANQLINLTISSAASGAPTLSNIGGLVGNLALAVGTVIERAIGGQGNDKIIGNQTSNGLFGGGGNDRLYGQSGSDKVYGNAGNDKLYAAAGNDLYDGGAGSDWIVFSGASRVFVDLGHTGPQNTGYGTDTIVDIEHIRGGDVSDRLMGNSDDNVLVGNAGHDRLVGRAGNDKLVGGSHNDALFGGAGNDKIFGESGHDRLYGGVGDDDLRGGQGRDIIDGGAGNDILFAGVDYERDIIVFRNANDSVNGQFRDRVYQFDSGEDDLHLRQIDANIHADGNQKLGFSTNGARAHSVWVDEAGRHSLVRGDVDGDAIHDFEIAIMGVDSVHWNDFIL